MSARALQLVEGMQKANKEAQATLLQLDAERSYAINRLRFIQDVLTGKWTAMKADQLPAHIDEVLEELGRHE